MKKRGKFTPKPVIDECKHIETSGVFLGQSFEYINLERKKKHTIKEFKNQSIKNYFSDLGTLEESERIEQLSRTWATTEFADWRSSLQEEEKKL